MRRLCQEGDAGFPGVTIDHGTRVGFVCLVGFHLYAPAGIHPGSTGTRVDAVPFDLVRDQRPLSGLIAPDPGQWSRSLTDVDEIRPWVNTKRTSSVRDSTPSLVNTWFR